MYIVEGNIGAGKSTFLTLVNQHAPNISVSLEPLHNWQKQANGQSLLANFIKTPNRWSYTMETLTMMCRVKEHLQEQAHPQHQRIMERSIYSGHYCFALNGYESGYMSDVEWNMYSQWFNFLIPGKCKVPQGFIYLKVDPAIAYERIAKRNRDGESDIPLEYLQALDRKHNQFLLEKKNILPELKDVPVLTLDCNQEFESDLLVMKKHIQTIEEFMQETLLQATAPIPPQNQPQQKQWWKF